jgi:serine protease Do
VNRFGPGVEIRQVSPGSPAALAGLVSGDVIVSINGQPVKDQDDLFLSIGMNLAGTPTRLVVERGLARTKSTVTAILAKYYVPGPVIASSRPPARGGLRVDYTSLLSQRAPILMLGRGPPAGVIIREVISNSPADKARLQPDKIITAVNGRPVASPADYYREMEKAEGRANLTVLDSEGRPERVSLELR